MNSMLFSFKITNLSLLPSGGFVDISELSTYILQKYKVGAGPGQRAFPFLTLEQSNFRVDKEHNHVVWDTSLSRGFNLIQIELSSGTSFGDFSRSIVS